MPDASLLEAQSVATRLVGAPVELQRILAGGRNSRIYRVCSGDRTFALKQYPARADDPRDRLSTEVGALRLMERCEVTDVPRIVGVDPQHGYALLTWLDGADVGELRDADIDAAAAFLKAIHRLRHAAGAADQPLAAEACLAGVEIERQINTRLAVLRRLRGEQELVDFLDDLFCPELARQIAEARQAAAAAGLDFAAELPQEWRSLLPADFGFHNSVRRGDGSLAFVDFEYFGWDDPVKLSADILLHPGRPLSPPQRDRFRASAVRIYGEDPGFERRLT